MSKSKLEYIWLDGYFPTQNMRSKTKLVENFSGNLKQNGIKYGTKNMVPVNAKYFAKYGTNKREIFRK